MWLLVSICFFLFNAAATTEIYTLSLHDALPISVRRIASCRYGTDRRPLIVRSLRREPLLSRPRAEFPARAAIPCAARSEEHTSELQSQFHLVCRLLLEKKKRTTHDASAS